MTTESKVLEHPIYWYYLISKTLILSLFYVLEHPIYWYYLIPGDVHICPSWVLEHPIYWYYLINAEGKQWLNWVLEHPIYWYYLIDIRLLCLCRVFLSIPFIGIIWSQDVRSCRAYRSWASHLLVLFDRVKTRSMSASVLEHPIYWYYLISWGILRGDWWVLEHPIYWYYLICSYTCYRQWMVLEHPIYWYYLICTLTEGINTLVLEHPIYWYYLIYRTMWSAVRWFLSIPFIGIIWSLALWSMMGQEFLSIPFIGIIWSF